MARGVDYDDELLARAGRGDTAAIRRLIGLKAPRILALAGRMLGDMAEAEDIAQEAFVRIWRTAAKWRPGEARFDTWLHRVTLNLCYDRLRLRRPSAELTPDLVDSGAAPDDGVRSGDIARTVELAIQRLPPRQKEAIVLCHYQELTNIEAAKVMETTVEALESLLARARRTLRATLAPYMNEF